MTTLVVPASSIPGIVDGDWADCVPDSYAFAGGPAPYAEMQVTTQNGGGTGTAYATGTGWAFAQSGSGDECLEYP